MKIAKLCSSLGIVTRRQAVLDTPPGHAYCLAMTLDRREFIQTAAASTAAAAIPAGSATAAQIPGFTLNQTPLKLGLMTYLVGQSWDIPTIIKNLKETKYDHVQLRTTHKHGVELTLTKAQRAEVKQRFIDAGLKISTASTYQYHDADPAMVRQNIEGTKQFLELTADVGAQGVRVFPNGVPDEGNPNREKTLEQIGKSVSECATVAHGLGVQLRLEEHGNGTSNIPTSGRSSITRTTRTSTSSGIARRPTPAREQGFQKAMKACRSRSSSTW